MSDDLKPAAEPDGTTIFLRNEPWFSRMRMLRLLCMLAIGAVVALVLWMVEAKRRPVVPAPAAAPAALVK